MLTVDQHDCRSWYDERRIRLTATLCKAVVRRCSDDCQPIVRQKLVPEFLGNAATRYGICHEQEAMAKYEAMMQSISPGLQVQKTGLVVSTTHPKALALCIARCSCDTSTDAQWNWFAGGKVSTQLS